MGTGRTDESRKDAVRIALTSGLSRRQVADDLGGGMSTLNKWGTAHRDTDVVSTDDRELARENDRLRDADCYLPTSRCADRLNPPNTPVSRSSACLPTLGSPAR
jgi:transposase-like protein